MKNLTLSDFKSLPKSADGRVAIFVGEDEYERVKACVDACNDIELDDIKCMNIRLLMESNDSCIELLNKSETDRNDLQAKLDEAAMLNGSLERQLADYRTSYEIARDHALKQDDQIQALIR